MYIFEAARPFNRKLKLHSKSSIYNLTAMMRLNYSVTDDTNLLKFQAAPLLEVLKLSHQPLLLVLLVLLQ